MRFGLIEWLKLTKYPVATAPGSDFVYRPLQNATQKAARVTITDPRVNLGSDNNSLFTGGGTALVIHAKADDLKTDPSGNSGDRIACGVIIK